MLVGLLKLPRKMMNIQLNETIDGSEIDKKPDFGLQQSLETFILRKKTVRIFRQVFEEISLERLS